MLPSNTKLENEHNLFSFSFFVASDIYVSGDGVGNTFKTGFPPGNKNFWPRVSQSIIHAPKWPRYYIKNAVSLTPAQI